MSPQVVNARFYVAKLIEEISAEDDPMRVIHRNVSVIYANSEQEAYDKALTVSMEYEPADPDRADKLVRIRFWGLGELNVIDDDPNTRIDFFQDEAMTLQRTSSQSWAPPAEVPAALLPLESPKHFSDTKLFWD